MEVPPSMHTICVPVKVVGNTLHLSQKDMLPYKKYRFKFLRRKMIVTLHLNPDRVDLYQEVGSELDHP